MISLAKATGISILHFLMPSFRDVEHLVKESVRKLLSLLSALPPDRDEPELRHRVQPILQEFAASLGLVVRERDEYVVAEGKRADAVFGRLVIEFKRPGSFASPRALVSAQDQLVQYMEALAKREGHRCLGGVVFDGQKVAFARMRNGQVHLEPPRLVDECSLADLLWWLSGLTGTALTAENLAWDFGLEHPRSREAIAAFYVTLTREVLTDPEGMVAKLFQQWKIFFSEAIDYREAFGGRKLEPLKRWVAKVGLEVQTTEEAERFFFALHTYFAILVKLIVWLALSRYLSPVLKAPLFEELGCCTSEELLAHLRKMEQGGLFREVFHIENLLEGDFFAWYLYTYNDPIENAIRSIIARLEEYDPTALRIDPDETRDLLKRLYHYLLPREIRHNLGEYYTPDWLAQRLLEMMDSDFFSDSEAALRRQRACIPKLRWPDPACGSGTFLILLIKRYLELGEKLMLPERDLLQMILNNVVGFDINPLAVITARVNYLLALGELLQHIPGSITIPVYLADSILLPELGHDLEFEGLYKVRTAVGVFHIPEVVFAQGRFARFCAPLEKALRDGMPSEAFVQTVVAKLGLSDREQEEAEKPLRALYEQLWDLHRRGLDGLWARLLLNNFAPLLVGQFDYVVGNPPWVNWENLPDGYRNDTKNLWDRYGLFPHTGMDVILGKGKKDISMLMTYVAADRFLKPYGKLGFVITQSLFKTAGAGQGFRRFKLGEGGDFLRVLHVDDMVDLNPFEGASNRTAAMILQKGQETKYEVPYTLWKRKKGVRFTYDSTLEEVRGATQIEHLQAVPVDPVDPTSPWLTVSKPALAAVKKILGQSDYTAHAGVYTGGANGVYWLRIIGQRPDGLVVVENITEGTKREVPKVTAVLEPDILYLLLRGRDVQRWKAEPSAYILMVQDPKTRRGIPEQELKARYPYTWQYLKRFESILRERKSRGISDMLAKGAPFYTMFAVGDYTFAHWKVVWREVSHLLNTAVVPSIDGKPTIPDHTIILTHCTSEAEAHFICGVLNSNLTRTVVEGYIVLHPDPHIMEHICIPKYAPLSSVHRALVEASQEAHEAVAKGNLKRLMGIENYIDSLAAQLWGLTPRELRIIISRKDARQKR